MECESSNSIQGVCVCVVMNRNAKNHAHYEFWGRGGKRDWWWHENDDDDNDDDDDDDINANKRRCWSILEMQQKKQKWAKLNKTSKTRKSEIKRDLC